MLCMEGFWSNSCRCAYTCVLLSEPNNSFTSTTIEHGLAIAKIPAVLWFFALCLLFSVSHVIVLCWPLSSTMTLSSTTSTANPELDTPSPLCTFPPWMPVDVENWYSVRFWPNSSCMTKRCSKTVPLFLHSFTDKGRLLSFNQLFLPLHHRTCQIMNWVTFISPILNSTHEWTLVLCKQFWVQNNGSFFSQLLFC